MFTIGQLVLILFGLGFLYACYEDFKKSRKNQTPQNFDFISFKID